MKIAVASDVHLEFGQLDLKNTENADVLILSGDIMVATDIRSNDPTGIMEGTTSDRYHKFMQQCSSEFKHVLYVAGNHEHYHGDFKFTTSILKDAFKYLENVHILDRETFEVDGVTFIGSTLWTDMNKADELTLYHMRSMMNDFRCVKNSNRDVVYNVPLYKVNDAYTEDGKNGGRYELDSNGNYIKVGMKKKIEPSKFSPEDALEDHYKNVSYIRTVIETIREKGNSNKVVVIGHHSPSHKSCHPYYAHDTVMNGGYHSNLEEFIMDRPEIVLWTHGHTHHEFDYMIGDTRVVCNPRGYIGHEARAREFTLKFVDI